MSITLDEFGMVAPSSGGGGGGGSVRFYKCASVDTSNSTWTGYLASVDPVTGVWSFAATATSGLTFDRITPVVGGVYDESCSFEVKQYKTGLPENGLLFYLSMAGGIGDKDDTGTWPLNRDAAAGFQFTTRDGVPCAEGGSNEADVGAFGASNLLPVLPNSSLSRFTISIWIDVINNADAGTCFGFTTLAGGAGLRPLAVGHEVHYGNSLLNYNNGTQTRIYNMSNNAMAFYHITYDGDKLRYYKNKSLLYDVAVSYPFGENVASVHPVVVQRGNWNSGRGTWGAFSAFRVYNRVLDSTEIEALAAEFSPTPL